MKTTTASTSTQNQSISDYLQNGCSRDEALRSGQLFDLTPIKAAPNACFIQPIAITAALWRTLAGEQPFTLDHPGLLQLARAVVVALAKTRFDRYAQGVFSETGWLHGVVGGRRLDCKLVCHPGDKIEPVLTLMLPEQSAQFEL